MKKNKYKFLLIQILILLSTAIFVSCTNGDNNIPDNDVEMDGDKDKAKINPIFAFSAKKTDNKNELSLSWSNPPNIAYVEIGYVLENNDKSDVRIVNVRIYGENKSQYLLKLPAKGTYLISAVAIDNYENRSDTVTITASPAEEDAPISVEIVNDRLPIADPSVLYYNEKYYAYGTRVNGFEVYISDDLKHWRRNKSLALPPENSWGTRWFWAPEVYYIESENRFYMFYSVDEHICVASATKPEGPFVQDDRRPIVINEKGIDTSLFIDDDGTPYLYYVRFTGGNVIWVAEMNKDLKSIKSETLKRCISAEEPWEKIQGTIAEGPSVFKINKTYYLIYSANHFESKDYAVGYAVSDSPMGPWKKYEGNPILRRDMPAASGLVGTGHGAPFVAADGSYKYIYHAHGSETSVGPRTSYINDLIISDKGIISITGETIRPVVIK